MRGGAAFGAAVFALLAAPVPVTAAPADRTAAVWTLLHGGRVTLLQGDRRVLTAVEDLPAGEAFQLAVVDWVGVNAVPEDLARLSELTALRELRLPGPLWNRNADGGKDLSGEMRHLARLGTLERITFSDHFLDRIRFRDAGLIAIGGLDNLRELSLRQSEVKGTGLAPFRLLESLDIELCPVNDDGLRPVGNMKGLRRLRAANTLVTAAGMTHLAGLAALEDLDLSGTEIDDAGLAQIAGLGKLRRLKLASTNLTDAAVDTLLRFSALEELNLYRTKLTNAGLARLNGLGNLRHLDVRYTRVTAAGVAGLAAAGRVQVEYSGTTVARSAAVAPPASGGASAVVGWIRRMGGTVSPDGAAVSLSSSALNDAGVAAIARLASTLRRLDLSATEVGDGAMPDLAKLTGLEELNLGSTAVTDQGLGQLSNLTGLRRLVLNNTYVEGAGLAAATGASLVELDLLGAPVSDAGLEAIARSAPGLKRLHLGETDVTGAGMESVAKLNGLEHLDLAATDVDDTGLAHIAKLSASLRFLRLRETRLGDKGLGRLAPLTRLEFLDLGRTRITSVGIAALAKLGALRSLVLEYAEVDDAGLAPLAALKGLRELNIDSTLVTDGAVDQLAGYTELERLNLYHTLITPAGANRLRQARPECRLIFDPESSVNNRRRA